MATKSAPLKSSPAKSAPTKPTPAKPAKRKPTPVKPVGTKTPTETSAATSGESARRGSDTPASADPSRLTVVATAGGRRLAVPSPTAPDAVWILLFDDEGEFERAHGVLFPGASGKSLSDLGFLPPANSSGSVMLRIEVGDRVRVLSGAGVPVVDPGAAGAPAAELIVTAPPTQRVIPIAEHETDLRYNVKLLFEPQTVKVTISQPESADHCDEPTCRVYDDVVE